MPPIKKTLIQLIKKNKKIVKIKKEAAHSKPGIKEYYALILEIAN